MEAIGWTLPTLIELLGPANALVAVKCNSQLLTTIQRAMSKLVEVLGHERAVKAATGNSQLLTTRVETIRDSFVALVEGLGHMVHDMERHPDVLMPRVDTGTIEGHIADMDARG